MDNKTAAVREHIIAEGQSPLAADTFCRQYTKLLNNQTHLLPESELQAIESLPRYEDLAEYSEAGEAALSKTVCFKLNGGLGTSMGLHKAKSLLPVKNKLTFLDIIVQQVLHLREHTKQPIPLVLMNSFSTEADSARVLTGYPELKKGQPDIPTAFLQHRVPKLRADNLEPAQSTHPDEAWCPPGHGDFYTALLSSGTLQKLRAAGYEYGFISNADNLGSALDLRLLGYLANTQAPLLMEVTQRTPADRKGGHLARNRDGHLLLRESAQCPDEDMDAFQDIERHRFFNTNNLWINLVELEELLKANDGIIDLPLIVNHKTLNPRDSESTPVIQLETAMGAAIALFPESKAVVVPRERFSPVKTTDDLLAVWSDAYVLTPDMNVRLSPDRKDGPLTVRLDPAYFKMIDEFKLRFPQGAPSLLRCSEFILEGDFLVEGNVSVSGRLHIKNHVRHRVVIPGGTTFTATCSSSD